MGVAAGVAVVDDGQDDHRVLAAITAQHVNGNDAAEQLGSGGLPGA